MRSSLWPPPGLHTNGYSLARKVLFDVAGYRLDTRIEETGSVLADELLKVHRSYLKAIQALIGDKLISAAAHITGGGITDNLPRVIPKGLAAVIDTSSWRVPPLFELLRKGWEPRRCRLATDLQSWRRDDLCCAPRQGALIWHCAL